MTKPQCKPGDLAIILGARNTPENNGKIVRVLRPYTGEVIEGVRWEADDGLLVWVIEAHGTDLVVTDKTGRKTISHVRAMADRILHPIRAPDQQGSTPTTNEIESI